MARNGYALGAEGGHITTARALKPKPSRRKGVSYEPAKERERTMDVFHTRSCRSLTPCSSLFACFQTISKRTKMCREIAREVVGLSPYERRILDMIKTGGSSADKRIYKFAKRRLGSHKRALAKREDIKEVNSKQRARAAGA